MRMIAEVLKIFEAFNNDADVDENKPYPNEHACRLQSPDKYKRIRRQNNWRRSNGKRIDAIWGVKKDNTTELQAMRYPKSVWTAGSAKSHCSGKGGSFEAAG